MNFGLMGKLKPAPIEIDLYVSPKMMTAKERKELGDFIEEYKLKRAQKKKPRKAA